MARAFMLLQSRSMSVFCSALKAGQKLGPWAAVVRLGRLPMPLPEGDRVRQAYAVGPCSFALLSMLLPAESCLSSARVAAFSPLVL